MPCVLDSPGVLLGLIVSRDTVSWGSGKMFSMFLSNPTYIYIYNFYLKKTTTTTTTKKKKKTPFGAPKKKTDLVFWGEVQVAPLM